MACSTVLIFISFKTSEISPLSSMSLQFSTGIIISTWLSFVMFIAQGRYELYLQKFSYGLTEEWITELRSADVKSFLKASGLNILSFGNG